MERIHDCKGRMACMGNVKTGLLEVLHKKHRTSATIPNGGIFKIEREDVITIVTRMNDKFEIQSYEKIV
ncbi:MAG: hypothetical protein BI182_12260 [Acetobacterium sp. MES1]|uniref:hypothetical protein n=1 Tax=Acetobacterium sp. MES1 TaxID=1899015 RepID=UPI000B9D445A|nr:hypothetical protein [Acetobacterium sp. MES1]OXS26897.1 MAG: hypothetical protein BI182_12260 [Acetobacterium sp. MES1]